MALQEPEPEVQGAYVHVQQPVPYPQADAAYAQVQEAVPAPYPEPHASVVNEPYNEKYEQIILVGNGVYGTVYQARDRKTGDIVAMKRLQLESGYPSDGIPAHVIREVSLLRDFKHPNVVQLLDVQVVSASEYNLIFEYIEHDLHRTLKGYRKIDEVMEMPLVAKYCEQLMSAIHACHCRLILHRDLKPQNILIGRDGLKICDFGLARIFSLPIKPYTHDVVTLWYRAPEILLGSQRYGPEVDLWSAGCIVAEIASGMPIFPGDSEIGTIFKIFKMLGTPTEETWPNFAQLEHWKATFPKWTGCNMVPIYRLRPDLGELGIALIRSLLTMNPQKRLTSRRAKGHAFFQKHNAQAAQQLQQAQRQPQWEPAPQCPSSQPLWEPEQQPLWEPTLVARTASQEQPAWCPPTDANVDAGANTINNPY